MPALAPLMEHPDSAFQIFADEESRLRSAYLRLDAPRPPSLVTSPEDLLADSVALLQLFLAAACMHEERQAADAVGQRLAPRDFIQRVRDRCGLDVFQVLRAVRGRLVPNLQQVQPAADPLSGNAILRVVRSTLEACPVDALEDLAIASGLERLGHACRTAYEGLEAFVIRNDPHVREQVRIVGGEYTRGNLDARAVAILLGVDVPDAVAVLESFGYARPVDVIRLADAERRERLEEIRRDRLARRGAVPYRSDRVAREVIASERIEGVDARPWIPRDSLR